MDLDGGRADFLSAISEANSVAIDASLRQGRPSSRKRAAFSTISSAACSEVAMSARRKATAWCSMIALPKVRRSLA